MSLRIVPPESSAPIVRPAVDEPTGPIAIDHRSLAALHDSLETTGVRLERELDELRKQHSRLSWTERAAFVALGLSLGTSLLIVLLVLVLVLR